MVDLLHHLTAGCTAPDTKIQVISFIKKCVSLTLDHQTPTGFARHKDLLPLLLNQKSLAAGNAISSDGLSLKAAHPYRVTSSTTLPLTNSECPHSCLLLRALPQVTAHLLLECLIANHSPLMCCLADLVPLFFLHEYFHPVTVHLLSIVGSVCQARVPRVVVREIIGSL